MKTHIEEIQWSWNHPVIQELLLKYYRDWLFSTPEKADEIIKEVLSLTSLEPPASILVSCLKNLFQDIGNLRCLEVAME
jgi:hypothetical protein